MSEGWPVEDAGVHIAACESAVDRLPSAADRLLDKEGIVDCKPDRADWRLDTTVAAAEADQPHPDGEPTESPLMLALARSKLLIALEA